MVSSIRRRIATLTVAGGLVTAGGALAATPAFAYHITYSSGGAAVPVGTTFTGTGGTLSALNSSGSTIATCTGSSLSGVTAAGSAGVAGVSSQLNVTSGTITGCSVAGSAVYVTVNASASTPWQKIPTGGTASPFTFKATGVNVTIRCGSPTATPATYSGNLTSGMTETNATAGSYIQLSDAASLAKSGSGCPTLPNPLYVTQRITITEVGGAAVTPTHNLWLNAN